MKPEKPSEEEKKDIEKIQQRVGGLTEDETLEQRDKLRKRIALRKWDLKRNQIHPAHRYRLKMMEKEVQFLKEHLSHLTAQTRSKPGPASADIYGKS